MCEEKTENECEKCRKCGYVPIVNKFYLTFQTAKGAKFIKTISDVKESCLPEMIEKTIKIEDMKETKLSPSTKLTLKIGGLIVGFALFIDGVFEAAKILFH